jgi:hypothetical protein
MKNKKSEKSRPHSPLKRNKKIIIKKNTTYLLRNYHEILLCTSTVFPVALSNYSVVDSHENVTFKEIFVHTHFTANSFRQFHFLNKTAMLRSMLKRDERESETYLRPKMMWPSVNNISISQRLPRRA